MHRVHVTLDMHCSLCTLWYQTDLWEAKLHESLPVPIKQFSAVVQEVYCGCEAVRQVTESYHSSIIRDAEKDYNASIYVERQPDVGAMYIL